MNIAELFIRRPVMTTLVMIAVVVFGFIGFRQLPVNSLPTVDFPTISVSTNFPGASPDTMAATVATPLERQFSTIAGLSSMSSSNTLGNTRITLQFNLDRNIDAAAQDVQAMIAKTARQLPPNMPAPPTYQKVNPAEQPVLFLSMNSQTLPLSSVDEYAETYVAPRISMLSGVAQVSVFGAQKYAVRAQLNPQELASRGIGIDEINDAVQNANVNLPTGTISGAYKAFTVLASGQLEDAAAFRSLVVAYRNGNPVRLEEIGNVIDSVENNKVASWYKTSRAIGLAVQRQPGTNTVQVVDSIKKLLPTLRAQIPASVNIDIVIDRAESIRSSIGDVQFSLLLAIGLVILVIFLFLRNVSATVIPSLALPISIVGTFGVMYALGYSINNLSMMALILAVGFVVDDAIVMLENIFRHMEKGEPTLSAALNGSREISFTIVSMTLSLVAVFIPVIFMGGILGRLLHEFAVTIGVAILVSGMVSLTLTPMACSRFLRLPAESNKKSFYSVSERFFNGMRKGYERSLSFVLRHRAFMMLLTAVIFVGTFLLYFKLPKGFLPSEDTGILFAFTEAQQGISFDSMKEHQLKVAAIILQDPNVDSFTSSVGSGGPTGGTNSGSMFIKLKPRPPRLLSADAMIQELRGKVSKIPGIRIFLQNPASLPIGGLLTKSQYQFTLQGPDTDELYNLKSRGIITRIAEAGVFRAP